MKKQKSLTVKLVQVGSAEECRQALAQARKIVFLKLMKKMTAQSK